jgi:hypothetical protein
VPFVYCNAGVEFDIEELPLDRWIEVQKATGLQWHQCLTQNMLGDVTVAKAVLDACAAETGTTLPARLTVKTMIELIQWRSGENTPQQFSEGLPDPKAQGSEPATT